MSDAWVPFEDRPRPPELAEALITVDRMKTLVITHEDDAALGRITAWLMGQMMRAKKDPP